MLTCKGRPRCGLAVVIVMLMLVSAGFASGADPRREAENAEYRAQLLYEKGQQALNDSAYEEAARNFAELYSQYHETKQAAEALYWQAFALYRIGEQERLQQATELLEQQLQMYEQAASHRDAEALLYRVYGMLAEKGDARTARRLAERSELENQQDYELEIKLAAVQALHNMSSERALPLLRKILQNRDPDSAKLREHAIFLVGEQAEDEAEAILLDVIRNDPSVEVRKHAVFWLSKIPSARSPAILEELLLASDDPELCEQAVYAIAQHDDERAAESLERVATDEAADLEVRQQAIHWLGQRHSGNYAEFLKKLYHQEESDRIKETIIGSLMQNDRHQDSSWLMEIAFDESESAEMRTMALHHACREMDCPPDELVKHYRRSQDKQLREMIVYLLSQNQDTAALEGLLLIAREEKDPELRKVIVFWIGQYDDPRVEEFLLKIINE